MSLPNRENWKFIATPRELQFLIAGLAIGAVAILVAQAANAPAAVWFLASVVLVIGFILLGLARIESRC